jgi:hypothetical protein
MEECTSMKGIHDTGTITLMNFTDIMLRQESIQVNLPQVQQTGKTQCLRIHFSGVAQWHDYHEFKRIQPPLQIYRFHIHKFNQPWTKIFWGKKLYLY